MKVRMPRKRVTIVVATAMALALGGAGVAYAYFSATGSGTGQATVGTSGTWTVTAAAAVGLMTPGGLTSTVPFTITNSGTGSQVYTTLTPSVVADVAGPEGVVMQHGVRLPECLVSWFTVTAAASVPAAGTSVLAGASATDNVTVTMLNPNVIQDTCKGATPDINLAVS